MGMWVSMMKNLRWCSVLMGVSNAVVIVLGSILMGLVYPSCGHKDIAPFAVILLGSCIRIGVMIRTAVAQQATARIILSSPWESADLETVIRQERRIRYKRWLWWTRFLVLTTVQQFVATVYLFLIVAEHMNQRGSRNCVLGTCLWCAFVNSPRLTGLAPWCAFDNYGPLNIRAGGVQIAPATRPLLEAWGGGWMGSGTKPATSEVSVGWAVPPGKLYAIEILVTINLESEHLLSSIGLQVLNQFRGHVSNSTKWQQNILVLFIVIVFFVAIVQCFTGSDVLRWRSFYATEDNAWKTHYREVFDHGIREVLCCLGRFKYLSDLDEDEIYSVAQILGDLVAYRAAGTGHLELLAGDMASVPLVTVLFLIALNLRGLALLQRPSESPKLHEECLEAPEDRIQEAAIFHPFAEAAYTGLLLDIGRNPVLFPCAWLYRQGILTPWTRNRCPVLEGDNWWRGHAAAFLRYVNLSAEALRQGRVNQGKCEAAYFIVVLHHLKSVVIAVRGTETPEDLITDGLCRECTLSMEDLDGLIK
ncbi:lipase class 3 family protein [Actinidia rufa]|uniref:Lipase class 3 family protein n=1 Tax=Actinidia rufa TaxID=165716 RepID=A0A7J0F4K5_9ERIC|nr:lipase class 3 family protein [Actinidia rufa]